VALLGCSKSSDREAQSAATSTSETPSYAEDEASTPSTTPKTEQPVGEVSKDAEEAGSVGPEHMGAESSGERSMNAPDEGYPKPPTGAQTSGVETNKNAGSVIATQINRASMDVQQIATAECNMEERCENIGPSGKYASREECMRKVQSSYGDVTSQAACKTGLNPLRLDTCLHAIDTSSCGSPQDGVDKIEACRTGTLCQ